jgi:tyrosinase
VQVEIQINNSSSDSARFVTWSAAPCRVRMTDASGATAPATMVDLTCTAGSGGEVRLSNASSGPFANSLTLPVPMSGASVTFFVKGTFGKPSSALDDVTVEAKSAGTTVGSVNLTVRIRKDANTLTPAERDRFLAAMGTINNRGAGRFVDFRDMHDGRADREMHGNPGFLAWHRAYLLDLERDLQAIDPSVTIPYWRFDKPAPNVFTADFMGDADPLGAVQFTPGHALEFWTTDGMLGIDRNPGFNTATAAAFVRSETATIGLGTTFAKFRAMEGDPHGFAHTSFNGFIDNPSTAPKDPLFFLLHCNVDRLWAKWQQKNGLFDSSKAAAFFVGPGGSNRIGHNLGDTMWPWNGVTTAPRPSTTPPGGGIALSPFLNDPWVGPAPAVQNVFDFRGTVAASNQLGFDYDDVPV